MTISRGARSGRLVRSAIAVTAIGLALPAAAAAAGTDTYIVQLKDEPLASYTGGTQGIPGHQPEGHRATSSRPTRPPGSTTARTWPAARKRCSTGSPGATPDVVRSYRFALAGFAAKLTDGQAKRAQEGPGRRARLEGRAAAAPAGRRRPGHAAGRLQRRRRVLPAPDRPDGRAVEAARRARQPQRRRRRRDRRRHRHRHPARATRASPTAAAASSASPTTPPAVWDGACQAGDGFAISDCNNKLIGARYFVDGFGRENLDPESHLSPRDDDGHGTHTASTAAGNYGVDPVIDGNDLGVDVISGISPRSYVAAYKVCWEGNGVTSAAGCSIARLRRGDRRRRRRRRRRHQLLGRQRHVGRASAPDELAFLGASDAGVFVANSAGNAGPGAGTVGSPASVPWLTTVAASTLRARVHLDRDGQGRERDVHGQGRVGHQRAARHAAGRRRQGRPAPASRPRTPRSASTNTLDPAKVAGKVVLCLRGDNARIDKSLQVKNAGGVGMILYNPTDAQDLDTDTHWVPTAHVNFTDGKRVKDAIARGPVTASLTQGKAGPDKRTRDGRVLLARAADGGAGPGRSPTSTAPGVQILAGAADQPTPTTHAAPGPALPGDPGHVDGLAARRGRGRPAHAGASDAVAGRAQVRADAHGEPERAQGGRQDAGRPRSTAARARSTRTRPPTRASSWTPRPTTTCPTSSTSIRRSSTATSRRLRPNDLNLALDLVQQVRRQGHRPRASSRASTRPRRAGRCPSKGWPASSATATQGQFFTIKPGQTQPITVQLQQVNAPLNKYVFGSLVLTSGSRTLRVPISVKPIPVAAPTKVTVNTAAAAGLAGRSRSRRASPGSSPASAGASRRRPSRPASGSRPPPAIPTRAAPIRARSCTR